MPRGGTRTSEPGSPSGSSAVSTERSRASASGHSSSPPWRAKFAEHCCTPSIRRLLSGIGSGGCRPRGAASEKKRRKYGGDVREVDRLFAVQWRGRQSPKGSRYEATINNPG